MEKIFQNIVSGLIITLLVYGIFFNNTGDVKRLEKNITEINHNIDSIKSVLKVRRDTLKIIQKEKAKIYNYYYKTYEKAKNIPDSLVWFDFVKRVNSLYPARFDESNKKSQ